MTVEIPQLIGHQNNTKINLLKNNRIHLNSPGKTRKFGIALGRAALPGDVICLDGDLGAGKTTLAQAIGIGLEVPEQSYITSPTFAILHEYQGRIPLYHMDFYRLTSGEEVEDLGFDEYFYSHGLTVIEWPKIASDLVPDSRLYLTLSIIDEQRRQIVFDFGKSDWCKRLQHQSI